MVEIVLNFCRFCSVVKQFQPVVHAGHSCCVVITGKKSGCWTIKSEHVNANDNSFVKILTFTNICCVKPTVVDVCIPSICWKAVYLFNTRTCFGYSPKVFFQYIFSLKNRFVHGSAFFSCKSVLRFSEFRDLVLLN